MKTYSVNCLASDETEIEEIATGLSQEDARDMLENELKFYGWHCPNQYTVKRVSPDLAFVIETENSSVTNQTFFVKEEGRL